MMILLHALSTRLAAYLMQYDAENIYSVSIIAYGIEHLLADATQIGILLLIAMLFPAITLPLVAFTICFMLLKCRVGGWHASSHLNCWISFTILAATAALISLVVADRFGVVGIVICYIVAILLIFRYAPILHANHPLSISEIMRNRKIGRWLVLTQAITVTLASMLCPNLHTVWVAASLGSLSAAVFLLPAIIQLRKEVA